MSIRSVILIFLFFIAGCDTYPKVGYTTVRECNTLEERKRLAKFIVDCTVLDEDSVYACRNVGQEILCPAVTYKTTRYIDGTTLSVAVRSTTLN
jgi:hypothetical protein